MGAGHKPLPPHCVPFLGGDSMLDAEKLLTKVVECADQMMLIAEKLQKGDLGAGEANAITNAYRSAGSLYISVITTAEGAKIILHGSNIHTELSDADRERLDEIAKLLTEKPSKRARKAK